MDNRYSRHILLDGFGEEGQARVRKARVLIVGCGGLGSPVAMYLAAAGVGTIGLVDADIVTLSNLQRQIIHWEENLEQQKVDSAADKMQRINPEVTVRTYATMLTRENAEEIMAEYDFVLDCTDSHTSKYIVADACTQYRKSYCCGGVVAYSAQIMTCLPGTMGYRDLFAEVPDEVQTSATIGVLGPAVGVMGSIQACEAIKYITGIGELLTNKLLTIDVRTMKFQTYVF